MLVQKSYMSVQKSPDQRKPEKSLKKVQKWKSWGKSLKKKSNNLGKKIKFKESLEKNVGKIGEKKVEKSWKKFYVGTKSYMSVKKSLARKEAKKSWKKAVKEVWKKLKKSSGKTWKNVGKIGEKKVGKKSKKKFHVNACWYKKSPARRAKIFFLRGGQVGGGTLKGG